MEPHLEGGYYRETYRAAESIPHAALPQRFAGERALATAIHFLMPAGHWFSAYPNPGGAYAWSAAPSHRVSIAPTLKWEIVPRFSGISRRQRKLSRGARIRSIYG